MTFSTKCIQLVVMFSSALPSEAVFVVRPKRVQATQPST